jgi:hypothetical protein
MLDTLSEGYSPGVPNVNVEGIGEARPNGERSPEAYSSAPVPRLLEPKRSLSFIVGVVSELTPRLNADMKAGLED